jgi:hypothetical protein
MKKRTGRDNPVRSGKQYRFMQAARSGASYAGAVSKRVAEEMIHKTPKRLRKKYARGNPDTADEMTESFHGRPASETIDLVVTEEYEKDLSVIGLLEELEITDDEGKTAYAVSFKHHDHNSAFAKGGRESDTVYVLTNPQGTQLYLKGGDQALPKMESDGKILIDLGECYSITYWTDKYHLSDGTGFSSYIHKFGEEGGSRPMVVYNTLNETISLVGGSYKVESEGIKD